MVHCRVAEVRGVGSVGGCMDVHPPDDRHNSSQKTEAELFLHRFYFKEMQSIFLNKIRLLSKLAQQHLPLL